MNGNEKVASTCRAIRALHGLKQIELAERMNVSQQTVRSIEAGRSNATKYVYKICQATGVTLGEFDLIMDILANSSRRL